MGARTSKKIKFQGQRDVLQFRRIPRWVIGLPVLLAMGVLAGVAIASGWLPSLIIPKKVVVRGNAIVGASDIITATGKASRASLFHWWHAVGDIDNEKTRWLKSAQPRLAWGRTLVVEVAEQRPLLFVKASDNDYWMCDDGRLVLVDVELDTHPVFDQIKKLPIVELENSALELNSTEAEGILTAAACLRQALPGVMRRIKLDTNNVLWCYNQDGFAVKLGTLERISDKVNALPKALRICAAERRKLQYLDASDPEIFYQRWQEPPEA